MSNRKIVHYVRHGESTSNSAIEEALKAAGLADAASPEGGGGGGVLTEGSAKVTELSYAVMNDPAQFDTPLSPKGQEQARELARRGVTGGRPRARLFFWLMILIKEAWEALGFLPVGLRTRESNYHPGLLSIR